MVHRRSHLAAVAAAGIAGVLGVASLATVTWATTASAAGKSSTSGGTVRVAHVSSVGRVLVTTRGRTLYAFKPDAQKKATCTGSCAGVWPPLLASGKVVAGAGARKSMLGTVTDAGGKKQVTYDHWPLYTFVEDTGSGQAHGQGLTSYGGSWSTITAAGKAFTSSSSSSSGSGYGSSGGGVGY